MIATKQTVAAIAAEWRDHGRSERSAESRKWNGANSTREGASTGDTKGRTMRINITEIEATAEEIRSSNTLADGLAMMLRRAFMPSLFSEKDDTCAEEGQDDAED